MRILVCTIGRLKDGPERALVQRYLERANQIGRTMGVASVEIREFAESRARSSQERKKEEAANLRSALPPNTILVCLDENGKSPDSVKFSRSIEHWRDSGTPALAFLIGGADGLEQELLQHSSLLMAFGAMTWPHQIVRVLLLEQIYRALTIIQGHPYHRE